MLSSMTEMPLRDRVQEARDRGLAVWRRASPVLVPVGIALLAWAGVAFGGEHPPLG